MNLLFRTGIRRISPKIGWINLVVALAAFPAAADSAFIRAPLQRTGEDANATGLVTLNLAPQTSSFLLQASNLAPGRIYTVNAGGIQRGRFLANASGNGQLRFSQPSTAGTTPFNFDPRGRQVVVAQNGRPVLRAMISGPGEPRGSRVSEEVTLRGTPGTAGGAEASYELLANGTRNFSVTLTNVTDGDWVLYANGIRRGKIEVTGGTGTLTFDNVAATPARGLNFDPRGLVLDVLSGDTVRFSSTFRARARGINAATPSVQTYIIPATDPAVAGLARARRWVDRHGRREFDIELLNLSTGNYELLVNGVLRAIIPVFVTTAGTEGEVKFATEPDDEEELLLNFNALTSTYTIRRDGFVLFRGRPVARNFTNSLTPMRIEAPLLNRGLDGDATATALFKRDDRGRRHFAIELKNLVPNDYFLTVDDLPVAILWVAPGTTRALLQFEDQPESGEAPLTFDPLGKEIGIERGDKRYFTRSFPANISP